MLKGRNICWKREIYAEREKYMLKGRNTCWKREIYAEREKYILKESNICRKVEIKGRLKGYNNEGWKDGWKGIIMKDKKKAERVK